MLRLKVILLTTVMIGAQFCVSPSAEAGPLLDWIRGLRRARQCNSCQPPTTYRPTAYQTNAAVNPYNLQPGQCARTCNQTCSRVVVNYVPYTAYRTDWKRVPVTQYRPETNSDPCTGCTVTCMKPCTTYNWQMQRVPYTTYRPVYRTENYTVPVTTITNDCATGNCGVPSAGCATCPTPSTVQYGNVLPQSSTVLAPNGTVGTAGNYQAVPGQNIPQYSSGAAADSAPQIDGSINPQSYQRPIIDRIETLPMEGSSTRTPVPVTPSNASPLNQQTSPAVINFGNQTAMSPIRKKWNYTVRLASYTSGEVVSERNSKPTQIQGTYIPAKKKPAKANSAWKSVEW